MTERLVLVCAAGSTAALLLASVVQALQLKRLRSRLDEAAESKGADPSGGSRPRFGRIYEESESAFTLLQSHPSEAALGAAAILLIAALVLGVGGRASSDPTASEVAVAGLRRTVDSLSARIGQLQDTVRLAVVRPGSDPTHRAVDAAKPVNTQVASTPTAKPSGRPQRGIIARPAAPSEIVPPPPPDPSVAARP
jgi:hypothetical protein